MYLSTKKVGFSVEYELLLNLKVRRSETCILLSVQVNIKLHWPNSKGTTYVLYMCTHVCSRVWARIREKDESQRKDHGINTSGAKGMSLKDFMTKMVCSMLIGQCQSLQ